jgi:hypothetical protein
MKIVRILVGIFVPLLMFGSCQTQEQKTKEESKFEQDLRGLYTDVQEITNQAQTRSLDGKWVPPTAAELELIFAEIARISEENGIAELVAASGYYQGGVPNLAEMDVYETLQWIEANGTPEYYNLMLEFGEEVLNIEQIIGNSNLLPNEKLGLITGKGVFTDGSTGGLGGITIGDDDTDPQNSTSACMDAYDITMNGCYNGLVITLITTVGIIVATELVTMGAGTPFAIIEGLIGGTAGYYTYINCRNGARATLRLCLDS